MLLPAMTFDPETCRIDFFFCLSFEGINEEELKAYLPILRFSTRGVISLKQFGRTLRIRMTIKNIDAVFPLTGLATHTSFEHNIVYRNVRKAESVVDTVYCAVQQLHELSATLKGDVLAAADIKRQEPDSGVSNLLQ